MTNLLFKRRALLSGALSIATAGASQGLLPMPTTAPAAIAVEPRLLQSFYIAGFQYYQGAQLWPALLPGVRLNMQREAANPYDPRAVAVYLGSAKLGFVPRTDNAAIAQLLDRGEALCARLAAVNPSTLWQALFIHSFW